MDLNPAFHRLSVARPERLRRRSPFLERSPAEAWEPLGGGVDEIFRLLDEAHRALDTPELAETLLAVGRAIRPLARGRPPSRPRTRFRSRGRVTPASRTYVRPIRVALHRAVRNVDPGNAAALMGLAALVDDHLDDVAARPRGSAIPAS